MDFGDIQNQLAGICDYAGASVVFSTVGLSEAVTRSFKAIYSAPRYDTALGETALDTQYPTITADNTHFTGIVRGDLCTVNGKAYSVIRTIPDGYQTTKAYLAYE